MIPLVDLKAQYRSIKPEIDSAISRVLESTQFALGSEVGAFEEEFAEYCQVRHAIGVNSGTSALHLALLAAGVGQGDEVITVPFTFVATVAAVCYTGARPVFVDIDPRSFTIDVSKIERAITKRTKVIMPVHLYGQAADLDPILDIAGRAGLTVIEDAAQAHGAEYNGRRVGSIGDIGCFSFYPGKNLGAYGEGGMVVTNNPKYDHTIRLLRNWGCERKYFHDIKGYNYRLEGIQGAILRVKLRHLDAWTDARRRHAVTYSDLLSDPEISTPQELEKRKHVYHIYAIRAEHRDLVQQALQKNDVETGIHYPIPVHLQKAHSDLGYRKGDFPVCETISNEILSLPMYPELSESQQQFVSSIVQNAIAGEQNHHAAGRKSF